MPATAPETSGAPARPQPHRERLDNLARRIVDNPAAATPEEIRRLAIFALTLDDDG